MLRLVPLRLTLWQRDGALSRYYDVPASTSVLTEVTSTARGPVARGLSPETALTLKSPEHLMPRAASSQNWVDFCVLFVVFGSAGGFNSLLTRSPLLV